MKIKAKRAFVAGRFSADLGDVIEVPKAKGERLISIGFAEAVGASKASKDSDKSQTGADGAATTADEKTPAEEKTSSEGAEKPAKAKSGGKRGRKAG